MESSSKHAKSDSGSSEENDHQELVKDGTISNTKRIYECTYCKRGFTNAQALGGHMNIHRKDRAKAKQNIHHHSVSTSSISNVTPNNNHENNYMISSSRHCFEPVILDDHHANNSVTYQPSSMVSYPTYHDPYTNVHKPSTIFNLGHDEDQHGANLSLRIGSTYLEGRDVVMRVNDQESDDLDLELRLGPDP